MCKICNEKCVNLTKYNFTQVKSNTLGHISLTYAKKKKKNHHDR